MLMVTELPKLLEAVHEDQVKCVMLVLQNGSLVARAGDAVFQGKVTAEVLSAIAANLWNSMDQREQMGSGMESMVVELEDAGVAAVKILDHLILVTCGPCDQLGLLKLKAYEMKKILVEQLKGY